MQFMPQITWKRNRQNMISYYVIYTKHLYLCVFMVLLVKRTYTPYGCFDTVY